MEIGSMNIPVDAIDMNTSRRGANPYRVSELAESIHNIGLINPISVAKSGENRFKLITGLHRL